MKIKVNFIEKKCLDKKLGYFTNKKIILFNPFYSFFENINKKFVFDFIIKELINKESKYNYYKNFFEEKKYNKKNKIKDIFIYEIVWENIKAIINIFLNIKIKNNNHNNNSRKI